MEDDVDVWQYTILELHARNDEDDGLNSAGGGVKVGVLRSWDLCWGV